MRRLHGVGLRTRIITIVAISILVTAAVAAVALLVPLQRRLRDDQFTELRSALRNAPNLLGDLPDGALRSGSRPLLRRLHLVARRTNAAAFLTDQNGVTLASTDPDAAIPPDVAVTAARTHHSVRRVSGSGSASEMTVAVPVTFAHRDFVVGLHKGLDDQRAAVSVVTRGLVVGGLAGLAVALALGAVLAWQGRASRGRTAPDGGRRRRAREHGGGRNRGRLP